MLDPVDEIRKFHKEMNKLFDGFFSRPSVKLLKEDGKNLARKPLSKLMQPVTNIIMKNNLITAKFDMPGIDKKDIELKVTEDYLEVKANKQFVKKIKKKNFVSESKSSSNYYRIIPFPTKIDIGSVQASYKNGVLEVKVKKLKESKEKSKKIKIK
jgi:HSP20 family protein